MEKTFISPSDLKTLMATAPVVIGYIAVHRGMPFAISSTSIIYVASGILLLLGGLVFLKRDLAGLRETIMKTGCPD